MGRMFLSHRYEVQYYWSDVTAKFYSLKITWVETAKCSCVTTFHTPLKNESANIPSWTTFESEIWQTESTHCRWSFTSHTLSCTKIFSINELNFNLKHPFSLVAECNPSHFRENSVKSGFFFPVNSGCSLSPPIPWIVSKFRGVFTEPQYRRRGRHLFLAVSIEMCILPAGNF